MKDRYGREINYMRISVTDRCNLRCRFCMPEGNVCFEESENLLSFDEIIKTVRAVIPLGIHNFRITGGEPFVRNGVTDFIKELKQQKGVEQVSITTNGILLGENLKRLKESAIDRINISLCSTEDLEYTFITGSKDKEKVMQAILAAVELGIYTKVNCVPLPNMNEDHLADVALLAKKYPIDVRFIEMMPIGKGASFGMIPNETIMKRFEKVFGKPIRSINVKGNGPAVYYKYDNFQGNIGFISACSHAFCSQCNRVRLTADGQLKLCLNFDKGIHIREDLRNGIAEEELTAKIKKEIYGKPLHHNFNTKEQSTYKKDDRFMTQIGG